MMAGSPSSLVWQPPRAPWGTPCLLLLLLALAFGGPAACVIHCQRHLPGTHLPIAQEQPEKMASYADQRHSGHAHDPQPVPGSDEHRVPRSEDHPSALTIAVVLPLVLLPALRVKRHLMITRSSVRQGQYPSPPRDPPRVALLQTWLLFG